MLMKYCCCLEKGFFQVEVLRMHCLPKILVKYFNSILNRINLIVFDLYGRLSDHFFSIKKTEGTGLSPSLSEGELVCLPLSNMQVLPPPSRFNASSQPRSL